MTTRRKRIIWYLVVTLLATAGLLLGFYRAFREPSTQGRYLSEWLAVGNIAATPAGKLPKTAAEPPPSDAQVREALLQMQAEAIPCLIGMLQRENPTFIAKLIRAVQKRSGQNLAMLDADQQRRLAVRGFIILGTNAVPATPELAKLFLSGKSTPEAVDCLKALGPSAFPSMLQGLTNAHPQVRLGALDAFSKIRDKPIQWLPQVIDLAREGNTEIALKAIHELGAFHDQVVIQALERLIDDPDSFRVTVAAAALARIGPDARGVLPTLRRRAAKESIFGPASDLRAAIASIEGPRWDDPQK